MSSTYNPQSIEEEIQKKWDQEKRYESKIDGRKNTTVFLCFLTHLVNYTWAMLEITQLVM